MINYLLRYAKSGTFWFAAVVAVCVAYWNRGANSSDAANIALSVIGMLAGATVASAAIIFNTMTNVSFVVATIKYEIDEKIYVVFLRSMKCDLLFLLLALCVVYLLRMLPHGDIPLIRTPFEGISRDDAVVFCSVFLSVSSVSAFLDVAQSMFEVLRIFYEHIKKECNRQRKDGE